MLRMAGKGNFSGDYTYTISGFGNMNIPEEEPPIYPIDYRQFPGFVNQNLNPIDNPISHFPSSARNYHVSPQNFNSSAAVNTIGFSRPGLFDNNSYGPPISSGLPVLSVPDDDDRELGEIRFDDSMQSSGGFSEKRRYDNTEHDISASKVSLAQKNVHQSTDQSTTRSVNESIRSGVSGFQALNKEENKMHSEESTVSFGKKNIQSGESSRSCKEREIKLEESKESPGESKIQSEEPVKKAEKDAKTVEMPDGDFSVSIEVHEIVKVAENGMDKAELTKEHNDPKGLGKDKKKNDDGGEGACNEREAKKAADYYVTDEDKDISDASTILEDSDEISIKIKGKKALKKKAKKGNSTLKKVPGQNKEPKQKATCEKCGKILGCLRALERHMNLHNGTYTCKVCKKVCNSEFSLKSHMKIHQGFAGNEKCNVCDKTFYDTSSLNKHTLSVHMGITNYQCKHCNKSFYARKTYEEHERVHTGERPFKCNQCPKTYKRIADLNHHIRLHKGETSHTCEKCGEGFRRVSELKRHMQKHNLDLSTKSSMLLVKRHCCEWCGIYFSTSKALTMHRDTHMEKAVGKTFMKETKQDEFTQEKQKMVNKIVQDLGGGFLYGDFPADTRNMNNPLSWNNIQYPEDLSIHNGAGARNTVGGPFGFQKYLPSERAHTDFRTNHFPVSLSTQPPDALLNYQNTAVKETKNVSKALDTNATESSINKVINDAIFPSVSSSEDKTDAQNIIEDSVDLNKVKKESVDDSYGENYFDNGDDNGDEVDVEDAYGDSDDDFKQETKLEVEIENDEDLVDYGGDTDIEDYNYVMVDAKQENDEGLENLVKTEEDDMIENVVKFENTEVSESDVTITENAGLKVKGAKIGKNAKSIKKRKQSSPRKRQNKGLDSEIEEETDTIENENKKVKKTTLKKPGVKGVKVDGDNDLDKKSGSSRWICSQCGKQFSSRPALVKHKNLHSGIFTCGLCSKSFSSQVSLDTHMDNHEGRKVNNSLCNVCDRKFYDTSSLNKHIKTVHMDFKPFLCPDCGLRFSERKTLAEHIRVHTGERPFTCEFCGKTFKRVGELNFHIRRSHTNESKYHCEECGKGFLRPHQLKVHCQDKHNPLLPFRCSTCRKLFHTKMMLRDHQKSNHKEKRHFCQKCGKGFYAKSKLTKHMKIRSDCMQKAWYINGVYVCKFCYAEFDVLLDRDRHITQNHVGDRIANQYMCKVCGKDFARGQTLKIHMKIHYQIRDYKCTECDATFVQKHHLDQHVRTHTGEKPFQCSICSKSFAQSATLYSHMKHH